MYETWYNVFSGSPLIKFTTDELMASLWPLPGGSSSSSFSRPPTTAGKERTDGDGGLGEGGAVQTQSWILYCIKAQPPSVSRPVAAAAVCV